MSTSWQFVRSTVLAEENASVDIDVRSIDEGGGIRGEIDDEVGHFFGSSLAFKRSHSRDALTDFGLGELVVKFRGDHARADSVDANPARSKLLCEAASHAHERAFRCSVGDPARTASVAAGLGTRLD